MSIFENEFDEAVYKNICSNGTSHSKQCIRSAIVHLEKAWTLKDNDKEMAVFRAITAEEEAATAIFLVLRERRYENAKKLNYKKHYYKQALEPFVTSIGKFTEKMKDLPGFPFGKEYQLRLEGKGKDEKLMLGFKHNGRLALPEPPLGFEIQKNDTLYHFEDELNEIISDANKSSMIKHVDELSNLRNEILYAQPNGVPTIESDVEGHLRRRRRVCITFMRIYALIYPHKQRAIFVQQSINAFLKMMGELAPKFE